MNRLTHLPLDALRLASLSTGLALVMALLGWTGYLDAKLADLALVLRGPLPPSPPIALVAVDDATASSLPRRQPLPRDLLSRLIWILDAHGAAVIGLDVLLDAPVHPAEDEALASTLKSLRSAQVVLAASLASRPGQSLRYLPPLPAFARHAFRTGYTNPDAPLAADGVTRSFRPLTPAARSGEDPHLSFPLALVQAYAEASGLRPEVLARSEADLGRSWMIRFLGPGGQFYMQSARALLEDEGVAELFRGKMVLIGGTFADPTTGERDAFRTPAQSFDPDAQPMSGLELIAQATQTLLDNRPLRPTPAWLNLVLAWLAAWLAASVTLRKPARWAPVLVLGMELAVVAAAYALFVTGDLWLGAAPALVSMPGAALLGLAARRARVEALLGRYASPALVAECLRRGRVPALGGEMVSQAVVLFADIQGYVALAAHLREEPQALVCLLNEHFTALTEAVLQHGGWVNSFMGDALLALFGVPPRAHPTPEQDALHAVKAALAMREAVQQLNQTRVRQGRPPVSMGIGLHIGPVVAGHIGAPQRMNYTVIGDAVNVAARLESLTREWFREREPPPPVAILLSGELHACVEPSIEARRWRGAAFVKNRPEPVEVYELVGLRA